MNESESHLQGTQSASTEGGEEPADQPARLSRQFSTQLDNCIACLQEEA
jgi:hypothetical protein